MKHQWVLRMAVNPALAIIHYGSSGKIDKSTLVRVPAVGKQLEGKAVSPKARLQ